MANVKLSLYIIGQATQSQRALENLQHLRQAELGADCEIAIVDISEHPDVAEREQILATPMLVRHDPRPVRKIIGDLSDRNKVLRGLELEGARDLQASGGADQAE